MTPVVNAVDKSDNKSESGCKRPYRVLTGRTKSFATSAIKLPLLAADVEEEELMMAAIMKIGGAVSWCYALSPYRWQRSLLVGMSRKKDLPWSRSSLKT